MTTHDHDQHARPVRIVAANPVAEHRAREARTITAIIAVICAVANACAIVPAVDHFVTAVMAAVAATAITVAVIRWAARRVRWWFEDRADARTAATWRAQHAQQGTRDDAIRAGVA